MNFVAVKRAGTGRRFVARVVRTIDNFLFSYFLRSVWDFLLGGSFKPAVNYSIDR